MNILQILPELNVGGVETGTLDLARHLVRLGHKAVVVSNGGELVKELCACGATHYQLPVHKKSVLSIWRLTKRLAGIIESEKIDIVHARSRVPAWIAYFACRRTKAIFITTCHGYYRRHLFSRVMGWGKRVIVISNAIGRHMIDDFGVPHERIRLVPRSVDLERFRYVSPDKKRKAEFNVGIIGRITPLKGHLHFIKAMARVARVVPHLKVWIVGDAPASKEAYKEQIQVLVRRLGLWHCTEFLGTQRDIPSILSHLDCLVLATTTQEAFGRVIVEAQAAGVPVVATKVGGVVDIIEDNQTGLLVPPADPQQMSEAVIRIFKDPQLASRLSEKAHAGVKERFNVELMVKNTIQVYQEALAHFKILVLKFSSLGDVILATAGLRALREKFPPPNYSLSVLVGEESKEVLLRCPYIDELLVCDFKGRDRGLAGFWRLGEKLRRGRFDVAIDLQNNRKSHLLSWLALVPDRYGYNNNKLGFLLNHSIPDERPRIDPVAHQFRVFKMLGVEAKDPGLELWPTQEDGRYVKELLASQWLADYQKIVGINISASERWETKNWPLASIARLCEELGRLDIRVVITGTNKDAARVGQLLAMLKNTKVINACAKTSVNQLACLIKRCSVYVSCDSAALHIAAAVGVPFVALFGPTDPQRHLPPAGPHALIVKGLACSPCYKPKCRQGTCMKLITCEEVVAEIQRLMK